MAPKLTARVLLAAATAVVALGTGSALGWEQHWCSADEGCSHWETRYTVVLEGKAITIRYRDTGFVIFEGKVEESRFKWTIEDGTIKGPNGDAGPVHKLSDVSLVQDRTGKGDKAEIEGTIAFEIIVGDNARESTRMAFEGTTEGKAIMKSVKDNVVKLFENQKIEVKTTTADGKEKHITDWQYLYGRLIKKPDGMRIRGIYRPPPAACSEAGRFRSEVERSQSESRLKRPQSQVGYTSEGKERIAAVRGISDLEYRSKIQREERDRRKEKGREGKLSAAAEGRYRTEHQAKERSARKEAGSEGVREAEAEPSHTGGPHGRGKFMQKVEGTISIRKDEISLNLPALPVLDSKCAVTDKLPAKTLTLKRHEP
jgi:hypothetical protein